MINTYYLTCTQVNKANSKRETTNRVVFHKGNALTLISAIILFLCIITITISLYKDFSTKAKGNENNNSYALSTTVVDINKANDEVLVEDFNGNLWAFNGTEDYELNDKVSMIMDTNGTEDIADDIILAVRYDGYER